MTCARGMQSGQQNYTKMFILKTKSVFFFKKQTKIHFQNFRPDPTLSAGRPDPWTSLLLKVYEHVEFISYRYFICTVGH